MHADTLRVEWKMFLGQEAVSRLCPSRRSHNLKMSGRLYGFDISSIDSEKLRSTKQAGKKADGRRENEL